MKKSIKYILFCAGAMFLAQAGFTSCSKWTEPEALDYTEPAPVGKVEAIKEYFKTPHKLMYGWFGRKRLAKRIMVTTRKICSTI